MGPWLRYPFDRLRHQRSRATELLRLRKRLVAARGPKRRSGEELELARRLRELRIGICRDTGFCQTCATCARGRPLPGGLWPGGHCCSGDPFILFDAAEVASLRASGTRPGDFRAPRAEHAGCPFRGPTGCSLEPAHRPNRCVAYACPELARELHGRGELDALEAAGKELTSLLEGFRRARASRREEAFVAALEDSLREPQS